MKIKKKNVIIIEPETRWSELHLCVFICSRSAVHLCPADVFVQLYLAQLLFQHFPLLCEGFTELLLVSDEQRQLADGTIQQIFRALLHHVAESVRLGDHHDPRLLQNTKRAVAGV